MRDLRYTSFDPAATGELLGKTASASDGFGALLIGSATIPPTGSIPDSAGAASSSSHASERFSKSRESPRESCLSLHRGFLPALR